MKSIVRYTYVLLLCISPILASGQKNASFTVKVEPSQVRMGEPFLLTYKVSADGKIKESEIGHIEFPEMPGIYKLKDGTITSSMNIVNNKVTNGREQSVILVSRRPGHIEIAPATVTIAGKKMRSNSITIFVSPERISYADSVAAMLQLNKRNNGGLDFSGDDFFKAVQQQMIKSKPHQPEGVTCRYDTTEYHIRAGKQLSISYHIYAVNVENMSREKMTDGLVKDFSYPAGITMVTRPKEYVSSWSDDGYREYEKVVSMTVSADAAGSYTIAPFHYILGEGEYTSPEVKILVE